MIPFPAGFVKLFTQKKKRIFNTLLKKYFFGRWGEIDRGEAVVNSVRKAKRRSHCTPKMIIPSAVANQRIRK